MSSCHLEVERKNAVAWPFLGIRERADSLKRDADGSWVELLGEVLLNTSGVGRRLLRYGLGSVVRQVAEQVWKAMR